MENIKLSDNIGFLLGHVASSMAHQSDQQLNEKLGLGFSQFKIMLVLKWKQNIQQKQIAIKLGQTEASISRQIKIMQQEGILDCSISSVNRRERIITLTTKGEQLVDQAIELLNSYHSPLFKMLSADQAECLRESLLILHQEISLYDNRS